MINKLRSISKRNVLLVIGSVAIGGWVLEQKMVAKKYFDYSKAPHASGEVRLSVQPQQEVILLNSIKRFAENRRMETSIRVIDPKNGGWAADFWDATLNVSGSNNPDQKTATFAFYVDKDVKQGSVLVLSIIDDFRDFILKIPGVTVL